MTEFEDALEQYRCALVATASTATTEIERRMYRLYSADLEAVERLYRQTGDAKWCRPLLESGRVLHQAALPTSTPVTTMQVAFEKLLQAS